MRGKCQFGGWKQVTTGKIATGRFRSNMAALEESSLSGDVNNALNEGKLACVTLGF